MYSGHQEQTNRWREEMIDFIKELEDLINRHSLENGSDTLDFLLANYLSECLGVYSRIVKKRDKWYNFKPWTTQ